MTDNIVPLRRAVPAGTASVQGTLALDLLPVVEPPARTEAGRPLDVAEVDEEARRRVDAFVAAYLRAAVEVAVGDRPAQQMLRHSVPDVLDDLRRRASLVRRAAGLAAHRGRGAGTVRPSIVSVRSSMIRVDAAEACAHVRHGDRSRALAGRFEVVRGRWQCVALEFA